MITAEQLIPHRKTSPDYERTEELKAKLAGLRRARHPFYLTLEEFDEILHWKLGSQYKRQKERRKANTEEIIRAVTGAVFSISHADEKYETELRLSLLCCLRGVGVPVASAVLALVFPEKYAVIDVRVWRQIFSEEKTTFTLADYQRYLTEVKRLALELGWTVQEVDLAIWDYDRVHSARLTSSKVRK